MAVVTKSKLRFYREITLIPDGVCSIYDIWRIVFRQVHLALVECGDRTIGLSFPGYVYSFKKKTLGTKIRLFSQNESALMRLQLDQYLEGVLDFCHISQIRVVPDDVQFGCFGRKQYRNDYEKIVRSKMVHLNVTEEQAMLLVGEFEPPAIDFPYIHYDSLSSKSRGVNASMQIAIQFKKVEDEVLGDFNSFGLSNTITVPIF